MDSISIAKDLPTWLVKLIWPSKIKKMMNANKGMTQFIKKCLEEHKATMDPDNPRDYMDRVLKV